MGEKLLSLQNLLDNLDKTKIMISPSLSMLLKCYAEDSPWRKRLTCLVKRSLGMSLPSKKRAFIFLWETNNLLNLQRILRSLQPAPTLLLSTCEENRGQHNCFCNCLQKRKDGKEHRASQGTTGAKVPLRQLLFQVAKLASAWFLLPGGPKCRLFGLS